jgi:hypothetical protein
MRVHSGTEYDRIMLPLEGEARIARQATAQAVAQDAADAERDEALPLSLAELIERRATSHATMRAAIDAASSRYRQHFAERHVLWWTMQDERRERHLETREAVVSLMRSDAAETAELLVSRGVSPTISVGQGLQNQGITLGSPGGWMLGVSYKATPKFVPERYPDVYVRRGLSDFDVHLQTIGLLASGELLAADWHGTPGEQLSSVQYRFGPEYDVVSGETLAPLWRIQRDVNPEDQAIRGIFKGQLEELGTHALARTMDSYYPRWTEDNSIF